MTASYIICASSPHPHYQTGVPDFAAPCFILLAYVEGRHPRRGSPFAAANYGGDPYKPTLQSWQYSCPPLSCRSCLCRSGSWPLITLPKGGSWWTWYGSCAVVCAGGARCSRDGGCYQDHLSTIALIAAGVVPLSSAMARRDRNGVIGGRDRPPACAPRAASACCHSLTMRRE